MMEFLFAGACNTIILISRGIAFISQDQGHPCTIPFVLRAVTGGVKTVRELIMFKEILQVILKQLKISHKTCCVQILCNCTHHIYVRDLASWGFINTFVKINIFKFELVKKITNKTAVTCMQLFFVNLGNGENKIKNKINNSSKLSRAQSTITALIRYFLGH